MPEGAPCCCWRRWWSTARANTRRSSSSCAARASCACASTAACTSWTRCRRSMPRRNTPSRWWWIGCASAPTRSSAWPSPWKPRSSSPAALRASRPTMPRRPAKAADEVLFSARQACPVCGYSVAALEPKMFSFNSPAGACPTCDGIGLKDFFDPGARRRLSTSVARGRRHQELGSQECLLLRADHGDGAATTSSIPKRRGKSCRRRRSR